MKKFIALSIMTAFLFCACRDAVKQADSSSSGDSSKIDNSWAMLPFTKVDSVNPILTPGNNTFFCPLWKKEIAWENKDVFNPAIVVRKDTVYMLYRAEDTVGKYAGTSRIGLAYSTDAIHFTKMPKPVFYPDNDAYKKYEWEGGCEDPRVVEDSSGTYYMTYTAYDGTVARLLIASSKDLLHWKKYGPVFDKALNGKYKNAWSKSGSIISTYNNGKIVATRIDGKYWMLWGDKYIWAATSTDLINWEPVETNEKQGYDSVYSNFNIAKLKIVMATRKKKFDSDLVESGPPAMITDKGILFLYNSRNVPAIGDSSLVLGTYAASQVLLDKNDPTKMIDRMETYFIRPDKPYETEGQVNQVCFIEGLAQFKGKWWLYYGTADSKIGVAVHE